jgi:hypothetical protein
LRNGLDATAKRRCEPLRRRRSRRNATRHGAATSATSFPARATRTRIRNCHPREPSADATPIRESARSPGRLTEKWHNIKTLYITSQPGEEKLWPAPCDGRVNFLGWAEADPRFSSFPAMNINAALIENNYP